ncbi:MAG: Ldh family oxidoreductase [Thermoanaerobacteraceae bacterium]|nr:Ldh family oxidoreductase [Thermoanaerobacteraceae bacterium]
MSTYVVDWQRLRVLCQKLLMTQGMTDEDAFTVADCLVDADLCGVESHGVSRMGIYLKRLQTKVVSSSFNVKIEKEYPASMVINAGNSMGMVAGKYAMKRSIEKARESGCCFTTVNNSNHYGMASYYVRMAAEAGMAGITGTNAPPNIAPWGSHKAYVGTNPIAFAVPKSGNPIILDMAPSVVAMGKVILAAKLGKSIPEGWALTKDGKPTTDPNEGMKGTVVPIGGPKGYGLSLFMDIFSGILSGAQFGPHLNNMWKDFKNPQNVGHFFCAIDISKFVDLDTFKKRVDQMVSEIKALPKNEGVDEIFVPGEIEYRRKAERKRNGILIPDVVYEELKSLCDDNGVEFTL